MENNKGAKNPNRPRFNVLRKDEHLCPTKKPEPPLRCLCHHQNKPCPCIPARQLEAAAVGLILCVTIIGIPFGMQCFKIAKLALVPFGAEVVDRQTPPV